MVSTPAAYVLSRRREPAMGGRHQPAELVQRLRGEVVAAVATPMAEDASVRYDALERYAAALTAASADGERVGGVAVWAHTGRGLHLSERDRVDVLRTWRQATELPVVAGAGVPHGADAETPERAADAAVRMAVTAAEHGADAVMVYPCAQLRDEPDRERRLVALHERVADETGLPVLGFYLHGEAGGFPYSPALIADLLAVPAVVGVKVATLDDAVACQDAIWAASGTGKLAVTGEDRMFGPSLMWGADSALVGIAAACTSLSTRLVHSWADGDHTAFVRHSARLDAFAAATFRAPIEGYVQRMLWAAVQEGLLDDDAAHDPYGPALSRTERDAVVASLDALTATA